MRRRRPSCPLPKVFGGVRFRLVQHTPLRGRGRHGKRWDRIRRLALDRDGWRCQCVESDCHGDGKCLRPGRLEVDHIRPIRDGGPLHDLANLMALCRPCHFTKTAGENSPQGPGILAWRRLVESDI